MDIFIHLLYLVHPNLDSVPLFAGMRERSIKYLSRKNDVGKYNIHECKSSGVTIFVSN